MTTVLSTVSSGSAVKVGTSRAHTYRPGTSSFSTSFYRRMNLKAAAVHQYGPSARLVSVGPGLYNWRAQVGRRRHTIDVRKEVRREYGPNYAAAAVGVGKDDWRAINELELANAGVEVPVMIVSVEEFKNVKNAQAALTRYKTVLITTQNWYKYRTAGHTYTLELPLVVKSTRTNRAWNALANSTNVDTHRADLVNAEIEAYRAASLPEPRLARVTLAIDAGTAGASGFGSASLGAFAAGVPQNTTLNCPASGSQNSACGEAEYGIGHEQGHTFGLAHSCDVYASDPNCGQSIMMFGHPWDAILLSGEIAAVLRTPYFH